MVELTRDGDVFVLSLGTDENRFHPDWLAAVEAALDEVDAAEGPKALVSSAHGKFWSNGLDLDWLSANSGEADAYVARVHELFARVLESGVPSVAAIQGHCFAAGAMLALAHDLRVMRADRGFFCLPEVDIQIPFTIGMGALIQARLTPQTAHVAMTTAFRFGGQAAAEAGILDAAVAEDDVLATAVGLVAPLAGKPQATRRTIKQRMYAPALAALRSGEDSLG